MGAVDDRRHAARFTHDPVVVPDDKELFKPGPEPYSKILTTGKTAWKPGGFKFEPVPAGSSQ